MTTGKGMLEYAARMKKAPTSSDMGPRTHDAQAIADKKRYFEGLEDWQELFAEVDRKDPNMRRGG